MSKHGRTPTPMRLARFPGITAIIACVVGGVVLLLGSLRPFSDDSVSKWNVCLALCVSRHRFSGVVEGKVFSFHQLRGHSSQSCSSSSECVLVSSLGADWPSVSECARLTGIIFWFMRNYPRQRVLLLRRVLGLNQKHVLILTVRGHSQKAQSKLLLWL